MLILPPTGNDMERPSFLSVRPSAVLPGLVIERAGMNFGQFGALMCENER